MQLFGGELGLAPGGLAAPSLAPLLVHVQGGGGHNPDHCTLLGLNNPPTAPRLSLGACTGLSTTVSCSASCAHARARHICTPVTRVCAYVPTAMHRYVHVHQACVHTDATLEQANTRLCVQKCPVQRCHTHHWVHTCACTRVRSYHLCANTRACTRVHRCHSPVCKHACMHTFTHILHSCVQTRMLPVA